MSRTSRMVSSCRPSNFRQSLVSSAYSSVQLCIQSVSRRRAARGEESGKYSSASCVRFMAENRCKNAMHAGAPFLTQARVHYISVPLLRDTTTYSFRSLMYTTFPCRRTSSSVRSHASPSPRMTERMSVPHALNWLLHFRFRIIRYARLCEKWCPCMHCIFAYFLRRCPHLHAVLLGEPEGRPEAYVAASRGQDGGEEPVGAVRVVLCAEPDAHAGGACHSACH